MIYLLKRRNIRPLGRPHVVRPQPGHHVVVLLAPAPEVVLRSARQMASAYHNSLVSLLQTQKLCCTASERGTSAHRSTGKMAHTCTCYGMILITGVDECACDAAQCKMQCVLLRARYSLLQAMGIVVWINGYSEHCKKPCSGVSCVSLSFQHECMWQLTLKPLTRANCCCVKTTLPPKNVG